MEEALCFGSVAQAGLEKIEAAKQYCLWNLYDAIEDLKFPTDLKKALAGNKTAQKHFEAFSNSCKKQILW